MGDARRELVGVALLLLALIAWVGLRAAVLVVAPELEVSVSVWTTHRDPWGNFLVRPPTGLHDTDAPVYDSMGPNGVDDTHMHDGAEEVLQLDYGAIEALTDTALITTLVLGSAPKAPYDLSRLIASSPPPQSSFSDALAGFPREPAWSRWETRIPRSRSAARSRWGRSSSPRGSGQPRRARPRR